MLSPPASDALPAPDLPALKSSLANASKLERARNPLALLRFRNAAIQVRAQLDRSQLQLSRSSTRATLLDVALRSMYGDGSEGDRAHIAVAASLVAQAQNGTYDPAWFKRSTEWRHMREIYANRWFKALRFATIFVFMIMQFWSHTRNATAATTMQTKTRAVGARLNGTARVCLCCADVRLSGRSLYGVAFNPRRQSSSIPIATTRGSMTATRRSVR